MDVPLPSLPGIDGATMRRLLATARGTVRAHASGWVRCDPVLWSGRADSANVGQFFGGWGAPESPGNEWCEPSIFSAREGNTQWLCLGRAREAGGIEVSCIRLASRPEMGLDGRPL